jgi:hypothetical protein
MPNASPNDIPNYTLNDTINYTINDNDNDAWDDYINDKLLDTCHYLIWPKLILFTCEMHLHWLMAPVALLFAKNPRLFCNSFDKMSFMQSKQLPQMTIFCLKWHRFLVIFALNNHRVVSEMTKNFCHLCLTTSEMTHAKKCHLCLLKWLKLTLTEMTQNAGIDAAVRTFFYCHLSTIDCP